VCWGDAEGVGRKIKIKNCDMKLISLFLLMAIILSGCKRYSLLSLGDNKRHQIIAFQPFNNYNEENLKNAAASISLFYNKRVIIFKPQNLPEHYFDTIVHQYNADSLLLFLSKLRNESIIEVIGLTHQPIFTLKEHKISPYYDENIFGIGYYPGNAAVISDYKFSTPDTIIFNRRLKNVIIHEVGHNLGLAHCLNDKCIMSEKNGNIVTLDISGDDYCSKCRKVLTK
jgi:archaemetzincin